MRLIPLSSIIIPPDRQRQEFSPGEMQDLVNSISSLGLLQPIIVRASTEGPVLVAGERRIRAIKDIWALGGHFLSGVALENPASPGVYTRPIHLPDSPIPCVDLGEISELTWMEAEYDENDKRTNLTWQEKAAATLRLARIRGKQAKEEGKPPPGPGDLAKELYPEVSLEVGNMGWFQDNTRKALIVAERFSDPEVAGAKSLDEAFKAVKRKEENTRRVALAARVGATFTSSVHQLHNADSLEWIKGVPDESFDVILTDPPYGMGADSFGDAGGGNHPHSYEDGEHVLRNMLSLNIFRQLLRVVKPQAHLYWFCDIEWFPGLKHHAEEDGWRVHRTPLIWHKPNGFLQPWPEHGPHRTYELILYAVKGDRKVLHRAADVITCPTEPGSTGPQKPVELFKELLKRSARPGDNVLDPFCGSGPIFPAAQALKVAAVGVEKDPASYTKALDRLNLLKGTP